MVRGHVAWALGRIGSPSAIAALQRRYALEEDRQAHGEIGTALGAFA
jgi:hypothetical protein